MEMRVPMVYPAAVLADVGDAAPWKLFGEPASAWSKRVDVPGAGSVSGEQYIKSLLIIVAPG
jgi:hypothetical protein